MRDLLPEESLTKKLVTQTFRVYLFTILAAPLGYFIRAIIANKLSIEDVGIFYSVLGLVTILASFNDLWLTEAMQYYLPKYWIKKKYSAYKTTLILTFLMQIVTGCIWLILLYRWADWLSIHHFHSTQALPLLHIFAWYFILINIFQLTTAYFTAFQNTFLAHFLNFFKQVTVLWWIFYFWMSEGSITLWGIAHAWLWWVGLVVVVGGLLFFKNYAKTLSLGSRKLETWELKSQFKYAWGVLLANNAGLLIWLIDQQLVINILWPQAAWIYANYLVLLIVYGVVSGPFLALIFPIVTELVAKQHHDKYVLLQDLLYKYYATFAVVISWLFFALGPELASIFFGTKFSGSGILVSWMAPFLVVNIMLAVNFTFLAWLGKVHERARLLISALIVNIVVNLIAFKWLGLDIYSPILATAISWIILRWWSFKKLDELYAIHFPWKFWLKNACLVIVLAIAIRRSKDMFFVDSNAFRYQNIGVFAVISVLYMLIFAVINHAGISAFITHLRAFRSNWSS